MVADFNGDGHADVGANCDGGDSCWRISYRGFLDWTSVSVQNSNFLGPQLAGIGRFLGHAEADVLSWNAVSPLIYAPTCDASYSGNHFCISIGAIYPANIHGTRDMR